MQVLVSRGPQAMASVGDPRGDGGTLSRKEHDPQQHILREPKGWWGEAEDWGSHYSWVQPQRSGNPCTGQGGASAPTLQCRNHSPSLTWLAFINNSVQIFRDQTVYTHFPFI